MTQGDAPLHTGAYGAAGDLGDLAHTDGAAVVEKAGLIYIDKGYEGKRPRARLSLTPAGDRALQDEVTQLNRIIHQIEQGGPASES